MSVSLRALRNDLTLWSGSSARRGRYDLDCRDHKLSEILNEDYLGDIDFLQAGDYIWITDCFDQIMTVRVDLIDKQARKCYLSRIDRLYAIPVVELKEELPDDPGLTYRFRGPRGGGHSVMTAAGEVFATGFDNRVDAERCIANCYAEKVFVPPAGHEPTGEIVKNAKIYKPQV